MPSRAARICTLCGNAHQAGERCAKGVAADSARKAAFDKKRPSARQRGYDAEWVRESKIFLAAYPSCVRCGGPATLVHHAVPHKGDKALFWDRRKWRSYCTPCHSGAAQSHERLNLARNPS